jgi:hypothetical protein
MKGLTMKLTTIRLNLHGLLVILLGVFAQAQNSARNRASEQCSLDLLHDSGLARARC